MRKRERLSGQERVSRLIILVLVIIAGALLYYCVNITGPEPETTVPVVSDTTTQITTTATTTVAPVVTEPPTTTSAPVTESTTALTTQPSTEPVTESTTATPVVDETEEILRVVTDTVNLIKSDKANFSGHKVQSINMKLVDSSVPSVNGIINGVLKNFIKDETYDYEFVNGVASDPENGGTCKSKDVFPPGDKLFELKKEGVAKAEKKQEGANTVYTVVIVPESSTLENPRPPHHNSAADTLDLSSVEIPIITLTKVDFEYPGATVSVTLGPDGKPVGYYERLPINGTGEGEGLGLTGYGTIEGYMEENWDIVWK